MIFSVFHLLPPLFFVNRILDGMKQSNQKPDKEAKMNTINFITHEPADMYHDRSRSGEFMSSHLLADFRKSPALYRKKILGEITETESPAFTIGRATHSLILEGRSAFDRDYLVADGPVNPRTGEPFGKTSKAYADWLESQEREIISGKDYGLMIKLQTSVWLHPAAAEFLTEGVAEGVVRTQYCGVPCQIRMDWFSPKHGLIDLKTCNELHWFEADARRFGYVLQLAFYRAVIREATGVNVPVHIIAVEKNEPFTAGVWKLTEEVLDAAETINRAALERYKACCLSNAWPTGYEDIRLIDNI
jgi:hypothetical protein